MQRWQNLFGVLKKKARIYGWLLVGFVPAQAYGLTENLTEPHRLLNGVCLLLAGVALVASFWIVLWRWEAIEQRRLPRRVRVLLLTLSGFMILFFAIISFEALAALGGLLAPWSG
jgi:hypothetical protein